MRRVVTAKRAFTAWALVVFAFLYLPILVMAVFAFNRPSVAALANFQLASESSFLMGGAW